ncbi:sporulation protein Cse60 [Ammoniphilus oxalaticus]|uniref:sporulation protein Cse60 n=1 Tax=Ammoniphilus oxalaticus TaxID=66863 RepID=UPI001FEB30AC|nr:sporulation protein Cse60 [Ammoniphilus oxalaticus]
MMDIKVKTFIGWTEKSLDKKMNAFLSELNGEIVDIKFSTPVFFFSAMLIYKE